MINILSASQAKQLDFLKSYIAIWIFTTIFLVSTNTVVFSQDVSMCSDQHLIEETLENGASWEMCWESRTREGIVFHDIKYTTPSGIKRTILNQASIAELYVHYDDNSASYLDVAAEGLGGVHLNRLAPEQCPNGELLPIEITRFVIPYTINVVCKTIHADGFAWVFSEDYALTSSLEIFSASQTGFYTYIPKWEFHDNGEITIHIGATGQLEEYDLLQGQSASYKDYSWYMGNQGSEGNEYGRYAISHIHNFWFRLDFDIDGAENDVVEEISFVFEEETTEVGQETRLEGKHRMIVTELLTETASTVSPEQFRLWRVKDSVIKNSEGMPISYRIEPVTQAIYRNTTDTWSAYDLYVTNHNPCEQFIVNNDIAECARDITTYTDNESLIDGDIVVWYGTSFHHLPRGEDEPKMPLHWEAFHLSPHDWTAENPTVNITPPAPSSVLAVNGQQQRQGQISSVWGQFILGVLAVSFITNIVIVRRFIGRSDPEFTNAQPPYNPTE